MPLIATVETTTATMPVEQPPAPIWDPHEIGIWSLFLTPGWGAVLISMNWRVLKDKHNAMKATIWAAAFFLSLPVMIASDGFLYVFLFLPAWYLFSCRPQAKYVLKTYGKSYPKRPWVNAVSFGWIAYALISWVIGVIMEKFLPGWI